MRIELPNLEAMALDFYYRLCIDEDGVYRPFAKTYRYMAGNRECGQEAEIEVMALFKQVFGSTSGLFGGVGGQAITSAYVTVFQEQFTGTVGVYCNSAFVYSIVNPSDRLWADVARRCMVPIKQSVIYDKTAKEE
ncbi:hypothetical protein FACS1894208_00890 [Clostridia bacterium]|nr:hypothetical protein FACS1894208_00890 [Clostridia bacterium]